MADWGMLSGLFVAAFGAATLLPLQSEAVLVAILLSSGLHWSIPLAVASIGNVLGSLVNYAIGRLVRSGRPPRLVRLDPARLDKAEAWFRRYGVWTLLLSFMPVIGDPLTLVAGLARVPVWLFVLLVTISKTGRYIVVTAATLGAAA